MLNQETTVRHMFSDREVYVSIKVSVSTKNFYTWEINVSGAKNPQEAIDLTFEADQKLRALYR